MPTIEVKLVGEKMVSSYWWELNKMHGIQNMEH